jgi:hypothetical protein
VTAEESSESAAADGGSGEQLGIWFQSFIQSSTSPAPPKGKSSMIGENIFLSAERPMNNHALGCWKQPLPGKSTFHFLFYV